MPLSGHQSGRSKISMYQMGIPYGGKDIPIFLTVTSVR